MLKKIFLPLLLAMAAFVFSCHEDEAAKPDPPIDDCLTSGSANIGIPVPGEYIITFSKTGTGGRAVTAARILARNNIAAQALHESFEGSNSYLLANLSDDEVNSLRTDEAIRQIEPDRYISSCGCLTVVSPDLITWNVSKVGYGDGTDKTAWVLDTGIDLDHPDLTVDAARSRSFVDGVTSADDDNGHGTHIAGIIGAKNNTFGTLGVAAGATLVSLKILDKEGNGRLSTALKALSYVAANGKAGDAANISLSLEVVSETLESEIRAVANKGIYVVIAAGNEGKSADSFSPSRTSGNNIYTISAVDSLNHFAGFSNYGASIDYAAPGVRVLSTYAGGKYAIMSGTSMAAPHVTGILLINKGKINSSGVALDDPDGTPDPIAHQ